FGLDGFMPEIDPSNEAVLLSSMQKAYEEFVKSEAGVNNGKSAIDFVLAKFPKVDPKRIYSSGHSSAATLSLLLAAKDHRISKCIAFAPVTDLRMRHGDMLKEPKIMRYFPGIRDYLRTGSPSSYVDVFRCPVFIVHARDDDNEPFANTKTFVSLLKSKGAEVKFVELRTGGHYQPIMDVGIPQAIAWLDKP
ncbi:MAG: prolyl oligopeptidase family serine peptidase, partial [Pirellula sp.]